MRLGVVLVLLLAAPGSAFAQAIEITADTEGTVHEGAVPPFTASTVYILARTGGCVAQGITGAEFWVSGLPAGWVVIASPNPASNIALVGSR